MHIYIVIMNSLLNDIRSITKWANSSRLRRIYFKSSSAIRTLCLYQFCIPPLSIL